MPSVITLTGDWLSNIGNRMQTSGTGNLGVYATGGLAVTAAQVGLGRIESLVVDPAGGYSFEYVRSTGKVKAYVNSGFAAHTHDIFVKGGQVAASTAAVAYYATDILGKEAVTDKTIVGADSATKGGIVAATSAASAAGEEVAGSTNLAGVTFNFRAIGV
jgi:hypothetical protein